MLAKRQAWKRKRNFESDIHGSAIVLLCYLWQITSPSSNFPSHLCTSWHSDLQILWRKTIISAGIWRAHCNQALNSAGASLSWSTAKSDGRWKAVAWTWTQAGKAHLLAGPTACAVGMKENGTLDRKGQHWPLRTQIAPGSGIKERAMRRKKC